MKGGGKGEREKGEGKGRGSRIPLKKVWQRACTIHIFNILNVNYYCNYNN